MIIFITEIQFETFDYCCGLLENFYNKKIEMKIEKINEI